MTQSKPDIILYGGPAAGKSTQASVLLKELGAAHLYMGGELRKLATQDTPLGRKVKEIINSGQLVSGETSGKIAEDFVLTIPVNQRIIFDGYPRTVEQAQDALGILKRHGRDAILVFIALPISAAMERLAARAQSSDRADDIDPTAVRTRIEIFQKEAEPLKNFFKSIGKYIEVDGSGTIDEVSKLLLNAVS